MHDTTRTELAKVPAVTFGFWIIKIAATTLGETGGDAVTMSMGLGYLVGTAIFAACFAALVTAQVRARHFHPWLFWLVIIATTTVGTTLADFVDRSLGIGYAGGATLLLLALLGSLALWRRITGTIHVGSVTGPREETLYWLTVLFSQTLGTALGDWTADADGGLGLGYGGAALVFGAALAIVAAAWFWTRISHTVLFWLAFILTRPLGATVGDFLDKPLSHGGLALSRYTASLVLVLVIAACLWFFPQRAEVVPVVQDPGEDPPRA